MIRWESPDPQFLGNSFLNYLKKLGWLGSAAQPYKTPLKRQIYCQASPIFRDNTVHTGNTYGGGRSLEGRVPSTAGQNQAVDRVTRPDVENAWHF